MKLKVFSWTMLFALFVLFSVAAQENASPVIDAATILQLQSVAHIDFADLPEEAGIVDKGWFATTFDGQKYVMINRKNNVVQWDIQSGYSITSSAVCINTEDAKPGGLIDGTFTRTNLFVAIYQNLNGYTVGYHPFGDDFVVKLCAEENAIPLRVWISESESGEENWIEIFPQDSNEKPYVRHMPILFGRDAGTVDSQKLLSGPENDPDSFMRIGRIDPPLAITVTKDALLKRWNLEMGEVTATAQLDSLPAAGQVNADGTFFTWVDQKFESLHLLDFETGQDQVIASLGGTYIPFLLLSVKADVIIGVNVGLEPRVIVWNVLTGERIDLGEYRTCNRQPDMVRMSKDGSTLVIGCDTGLDIWRVPVNL